MNTTNSVLIGASGGGDRPPADRNNSRLSRLCRCGIVSLIIMFIIILVEILFLFVIPSHSSRPCTNSSSVETVVTSFVNQCAFDSYASGATIYCFSIFNFFVALLITLCISSRVRCESISFYVLTVAVFFLFLLIKFYLSGDVVSQDSELPVFCYAVSLIALFITFALRFCLRRSLSSEVETDPVVGLLPVQNEPRPRETPPPPYTYLPGYEEIEMTDLSQRPPSYQEPPPVYTSRENIGDEDETQFGENGSEEDPYEDMPPLED
ncbi:hypothetical protein [Candidatus Similichlamydia epinepheli]|uniref:hypothetical protein n=1 Tax=Candidatus Similichlamydia epinepheli TaxID=1903953 RepID=UPI000D3560C5|nr:hypothetical protein [Candidatus Similichlamydia epinepheli]